MGQTDVFEQAHLAKLDEAARAHRARVKAEDDERAALRRAAAAGHSIRAIAAAVGESKSWVSRQLGNRG